MFQLSIAVLQIIPKLSGNHFITFHSFCGSEIWTGYWWDGLSLLHNIGGLSWEDLKIGGQLNS